MTTFEALPPGARRGLGLVLGLALWPIAARAQTLDTLRVSARAVVAGDSTDRFGALGTTTAASQIRDLSALDLTSALRRTPGVSVVRFNPVGSFGGGAGGALFIRGMGLSRPGAEIKTFVDGIPFYMGVWNHPLLDLLPVHGADDIVVRKGPHPQQTGNAFASVNLVPRTVREAGVHGSVSLAAGGFGTLTEQGALTLRSGDLDVSVTQGLTRSDGHRPLADGQLANALVRAEYRLSRRWRTDVIALATENRARDPGRAGAPESRTGQYNTRGVLTALALRHDDDRLRGMLRVYRSGGAGDWYDQPAPDGNTLSSFTLVGVQLREELTPWRGGTLSAGVDVDGIAGTVRFEAVAPASPSRFTSPDVRITQPHAAIAQEIALAGAWSMTPSVGARWYAHSQLSSTVAPHAGLVVRRGADIALRASAARGINYAGVDAIVLSALIPPLRESWRTLSPERLDQLELGASLSRAWSGARPLVRRTTLDVSLFENRSRGRYQFAFPPVSTPPSFLNLGDYRVRGMEASLQTELGGGATTFASFTALDPSLATLPYTPRRAFSAGLVWQARHVRLSMDVQGQSEMRVGPLGRSAASGTTPSIPGFSVWQVRMAVPVARLGQGGELFANLENALDRSYGYQPGYPMPGRWGMAGIRIGR